MSGVAHPPDLTVYAIPAFVALILVEQVVLRRRRRRIDGRDFWASIGMGLGSLVTINLLMGIVGWWAAGWFWEHRLADLGTSWRGWAVALVTWDLVFYVEHRLSHEVRFFWASHVGSNARYLDKNYGGILIVWDRLFGTFQAEDEPVTYGLTKNIGTYNLWTIAFHEWVGLAAEVRQARGIDRVRHALRGPGWQPAGPPVPTEAVVPVAGR